MSTYPPQQDIFSRRSYTPNDQQPLGGVGQDKGAHPRARIASAQPAPLKNIMRPHQMNSNHARVQIRSTPKRQTIHTTLHLKPGVRAELERRAQEEGLSISATGAALVEWAIKQSISAQQGALLETIIDKSIGKHMRSYSSRLAVLLVRSSYASEQTRSLVTNILTRQPGVSQTVLEEILNGSSRAAKRNIKYISPQLSELIKEIEKWIQEGEGGVSQ